MYQMKLYQKNSQKLNHMTESIKVHYTTPTNLSEVTYKNSDL